MSAERQRETCAAYREELLRQMYAGAEPSAAVQAHLATCATCRAARAAAQELAGALRAALQPEPLSEESVQRLRQRLTAETFPARFIRPRLVAVVGAAVAAGLLGAVLVPWWMQPSAARAPQGSAPHEITLSEEDAAAIVAAYTRVGWEGPTETSLSLLADQVSDVSRGIGREAGAETYLPWGPENDWDLPADEGGAIGLQPIWSFCSVAGDPWCTSGCCGNEYPGSGARRGVPTSPEPIS
jgi:hypothetical protein